MTIKQTADEKLARLFTEVLFNHIEAVNKRVLACDELAHILMKYLSKAGYKSPEELDAWAKANGYVKLANIREIYNQAGDLRELDRRLGEYLNDTDK